MKNNEWVKLLRENALVTESYEFDNVNELEKNAKEIVNYTQQKLGKAKVVVRRGYDDKFSTDLDAPTWKKILNKLRLKKWEFLEYKLTFAKPVNEIKHIFIQAFYDKKELKEKINYFYFIPATATQKGIYDVPIKNKKDLDTELAEIIKGSHLNR